MDFSKLTRAELQLYLSFVTIAGELSTDTLMACLKDVEGITGSNIRLFQAACRERLHGRSWGREGQGSIVEE